MASFAAANAARHNAFSYNPDLPHLDQVIHDAEHFIDDVVDGVTSFADAGEELAEAISDAVGLNNAIDRSVVSILGYSAGGLAGIGLNTASMIRGKGTKAPRGPRTKTTKEARGAPSVEPSARSNKRTAPIETTRIEPPSKVQHTLNKTSPGVSSASEGTSGTQSLSHYWPKQVEFKGNKVYQRNDIINPYKFDPKGSGMTNLQRMRNGDAPYGPDNKKVNLHHMLRTNEGAIAEMTATFHQQNTSIIHINPQTIPSGIDRASFRNWRKDYWIQRAKDFEK